MSQFDYSYEDIVKCLKNVGLKNGDKIFIHSNIGFFGKLKDANDSSKYYENFKTAIFEIIGSEGTLVVPTFTYSFMFRLLIVVAAYVCVVYIFVWFCYAPAYIYVMLPALCLWLCVDFLL